MRAPQRATLPSLAGRRVLVVENERSVAALLAECLMEMGAEARTVSDGTAALAIFAAGMALSGA